MTETDVFIQRHISLPEGYWTTIYNRSLQLILSLISNSKDFIQEVKTDLHVQNFELNFYLRTSQDETYNKKSFCFHIYFPLWDF
jgi:hypothetical protein